ncbi:MAG TPA: DNA-binding transcriptional regulator [Firmicutes bacterium]|jgi:predicted DNA-binding transcriptional regulator YafY|nr:DNA-binding transcriptional regulator [Bacillota bacterium]HCF88666.1 DNA-binding transcriptional regulator [Bacillota bacterium]HCF93258.1 DNA-binding transcriptional regulator [Bacillota bacterium]HCX70688.1 DNA-binding transcriptional regulator [Bacillota bacterium]
MKIDRLMGIITILLQNGKTTAPYLAERFEVSRRTILRDLDTLCQAGIPIITEQGGRGGISIMEGYQLDRSLLTADELQRLIAGLKSINSVSKESKPDSLLLKLAPNKTIAALADCIMIDLSSHYRDSLSEKISLIKEAITSRRLIFFDYYYRKGQVKRKVEPYFVVFKWTAWYVLGWCTERADFRLFKLNRLWDLSITDEVFMPREVPLETISLDNALPDQNKIEILFDRSVRFRLIEDYGLHCYTETDRGLLMKLNYTNRENAIAWVLSFGDQAEVLAPPDVRDEIAAIVRKLAARY